MQRSASQVSASKPDFMTTYLNFPTPAHTGTQDASVALWLIDIDTAGQALCAIEDAAPRLSVQERQDFATASNPSRVRIRYGARVALRLGLERWLGAPAVRKVAFETDRGGKPYLPDSGLDFSLTYSGALVLIGVRAGGAIGVDLECERAVKMSREKRAGIIALADAVHAGRHKAQPGDGPTEFLQAWTRMEAVAKATGLGIARVLGHFGLIGADAAGRASDANAAQEFADSYDLDVRDLAVAPGLYAAVAQVRGAVVPQIRNMPSEQAALEAFAANACHRR